MNRGDWEDVLAVVRWLDARAPTVGGTVSLTRQGKRATLWLDHIEARNAISTAMMGDLATHLGQLLFEDVPTTLVLRSRHAGAFCAGGNLKQVGPYLSQPDAGARMCRAMQQLLNVMLDGPWVSVAVVEGAAVGGGAELCTATDFRLMTPEAVVAFRQVALGVAAGWGGAGRLVRHVGRSQALAWLAGARTLTVQEMREAGFCTQTCDVEGVETALDAMLSPFERLDPGAVAAAKRQVVAGERGDLSAERAAFLSVWGGPGHRVGR